MIAKLQDCVTFGAPLKPPAAPVLPLPKPIDRAHDLIVGGSRTVRSRYRNSLFPMARSGAASGRCAILLIHGSATLMRKCRSGRASALAVARPDIVDFIVFEDAAHVSSWNQDRERYEDAVRRFLASVATTRKEGAPAARIAK